MAILIVDDEASTREALRNLLDRLGHGPILEAKNGEEALRVLAASGARIHMIVADWEMPYMDGLELVKTIAKAPEYDLIPFLLITSDLPRARIEEFHRENPRLDNHLFKPFRLKALAEAMSKAARHRASQRDVLVYLGAQLPAELSVAAKEPPGRSHWRELIQVASPVEFEALLVTHGMRVGALLVDPLAHGGGTGRDATDVGWLTSFKKTPAGTVTPVVCLGRNPLAIRAVRTQCQFFVDIPVENRPVFWTELLGRLSNRLAAGWDIEILSTETKALLQKNDFKAARKNFTALFALDEYNTDVCLMAAEICEGLGDVESARRHYVHATEINPCMPRPYIKLLGLSQDRSRLAETAVQFCPNNLDVLMAAAVAWVAEHEEPRALEVLKQILSVQPAHKAAKEMLGGMSR